MCFSKMYVDRCTITDTNKTPVWIIQDPCTLRWKVIRKEAKKSSMSCFMAQYSGAVHYTCINHIYNWHLFKRRANGTRIMTQPKRQLEIQIFFAKSTWNDKLLIAAKMSSSLISPEPRPFDEKNTSYHMPCYVILVLWSMSKSYLPTCQ